MNESVPLLDLGREERDFYRSKSFRSEEVKYQADAFGTVKTYAAQLKEEILTVVREAGADKVNIIAHFNGGPDAKYMIRYLEMAPYAASLTTRARSAEKLQAKGVF